MKRIGLLLLVALALTACDSSHGIDTENKDPRHGRVTTYLRADYAGIYEWDWMVCAGTTLVIHIDYPSIGDRYIDNAPECQP